MSTQNNTENDIEHKLKAVKDAPTISVASEVNQNNNEGTEAANTEQNNAKGPSLNPETTEGVSHADTSVALKNKDNTDKTAGLTSQKNNTTSDLEEE